MSRSKATAPTSCSTGAWCRSPSRGRPMSPSRVCRSITTILGLSKGRFSPAIRSAEASLSRSSRTPSTVSKATGFSSEAMTGSIRWGRASFSTRRPTGRSSTPAPTTTAIGPVRWEPGISATAWSSSHASVRGTFLRSEAFGTTKGLQDLTDVSRRWQCCHQRI